MLTWNKRWQKGVITLLMSLCTCKGDSKTSQNYVSPSRTVTGKIFENGFSDLYLCKVCGWCCCSTGTPHHRRKEINMASYILWTPPQLMPSNGSNLAWAKLWWHLLRQAAEVRNRSGEEDNLTLENSSPRATQLRSTGHNRTDVLEPTTAWTGARVSGTV